MSDEATVKEIEELENQRYAAMQAGDLESLKRLFSERLTYTHSNGARDTKASMLEKVGSGHFDYGPINHPNRSVTVAGDAVIVSGDMQADVKVQGEPRTLNNSALAVWVREGDEWKLLAYQPTPYPAG
ncbi:DUF4440 domain-containing protein [Epidermidibacterium keratini]|uniref:DUF4440 domain-containing protein n=1 Tax=Epidermidibacterium keratini TaxID=1891644 RepID=A0A7L4YLW9_9ACTN|nr:nuclear transport factor 2 family protein [Epidermidibacterium keratini]QHC00271.1 DUF4440 domain-containing protein [Epidermidibacterium keratini]